MDRWGHSMLCIALLLVLGAGPRAAAAQTTDAQLLLAWKASITDTWNSLLSWTGTDACVGTWAGVSCTNGRVTGLRLGGLGLAGKIPASGWSWPSSLQFAILNKNWFSGQLPSNWSLPALTSLYLSDNNFEGTLPTWDTMPSTQVFIKPGNSYLCGPVPSAPQYLDVMGAPVTLPICKSDAELLLELKNGITDTWNSLASWTGSNACSGSWAGVTCSQGRVVALRLGGLGLKGTIPAQSMLPSSIKYVYMNKNWFSGQIPKAWTVPSGLLELYASDNNFEGALPTWNLPNTKVYIRPGNSYLCGQMPQFPGYYDAAGGRIWALPPGPCKTDAQLLLAWKASIADDAGALASWTGSDACGGTWAGVSCAQGRVTRIKLDGLGLRGTITPATWLFPSTLASLNLGNNNFSGGLPFALTLPPNIQEFRIFGNSFTGPLPAWTNLVDTKVYMSPGNTGLCGTVPQWPAFYNAATDARIWALAACQGRKLKLM